MSDDFGLGRNTREPPDVSTSVGQPYGTYQSTWMERQDRRCSQFLRCQWASNICQHVHRLQRRSCHQLIVSNVLRSILFIRSRANTSDTTLDVDPYSYTSGRWLNRDILERESRYIQFDFAALCKKAVELCPGARRVLRYEKKEGGFNRSFIIIMDDGTKIVARLPTSIAGPRRLTTNSEVATMTYRELYLSG